MLDRRTKALLTSAKRSANCAFHTWVFRPAVNSKRVCKICRIHWRTTSASANNIVIVKYFGLATSRPLGTRLKRFANNAMLHTALDPVKPTLLSLASSSISCFVTAGLAGKVQKSTKNYGKSSFHRSRLYPME